MRTETKEIVVAEEEHGQRLDILLSRRYTDFSRNEWQQRIDGGFIKVNQLKPRSSRRLNKGDTIAITYTMRDEPEVPVTIAILFEDEDYLIVNKPPGIPVHPSGIYRLNTVTTMLVKAGILTTGHLLHRLDRETSGVLGLAKTREAAAAFQRILKAGKIDKDYRVIVEGSFTETVEARGYIYRMPDSRLPRQRFYKEGNPPEGAIEVQTCHTRFTPMMRHNGMTMLAARLFTGRMHQIRATLCSLGFPVVGDKLYGADASLYFKFAEGLLTPEDREKLRIDRSALHCEILTLPHPMRHNTWKLVAPLPDDMAQLFA